MKQNEIIPKHYVEDAQKMSLPDLRVEFTTLCKHLQDTRFHLTTDEQVKTLLLSSDPDAQEDFKALVSNYMQMSEELTCKKQFIELLIRQKALVA